MVATAIGITGENEERCAVRQTRTRYREFFLCAIVVAQTPEVIIGLGKMRFSRVGAETKRCVHRSLGERNPVRRWIEVEKEKQIVRARGVTICGDEVRVAFDRIVEGLQRL